MNLEVHVRECQIGEESIRDETQCQECDNSSYNFNPQKANGCAACPENADYTGRFIIPKESNWHKSPCHSSVKECLIEEACKYTDRQEILQSITNNFTECTQNQTDLKEYSEALCKEGYRGPLCGSCRESFGASLRSQCLSCPKNVRSVLVLILLCCCLLVLASITIRGSLPSVPKN